VAGNVDRSPIVDFKELAAVSDLRALELAKHAIAGVVDYDVSPAKLGDCGVKSGTDGRLGGQVYGLKKSVFRVGGGWERDRFGVAGECYDAVAWMR
jgi:hypothetical protein